MCRQQVKDFEGRLQECVKERDEMHRQKDCAEERAATLQAALEVGHLSRSYPLAAHTHTQARSERARARKLASEGEGGREQGTIMAWLTCRARQARKADESAAGSRAQSQVKEVEDACQRAKAHLLGELNDKERQLQLLRSQFAEAARAAKAAGIDAPSRPHRKIVREREGERQAGKGIGSKKEAEMER